MDSNSNADTMVYVDVMAFNSWPISVLPIASPSRAVLTILAVRGLTLVSVISDLSRAVFLGYYIICCNQQWLQKSNQQSSLS